MFNETTYMLLFSKAPIPASYGIQAFKVGNNIAIH